MYSLPALQFFRCLFLSGFFTLCSWPLTTHATNRYVETAGSDTIASVSGVGQPNDCTSLSTPCLTIQHAISQARPNDTILLTITPAPPPWIAQPWQFNEHSITVRKNLNFIGTGATRVPISANFNGRIFNILNPNATVSIRNIELINGRASNGAGIYNLGTLQLFNCKMQYNYNLPGDGGAIYNLGVLEVEASDLLSNGALRGGAIYTGTGGEVTLMNETIVHGNYADYGGAIYTSNESSVAITGGASVYSNRANADGGGVYVANSTLEISSSAFVYSNIASRDGGGVFNSEGIVSVDGGNFWYNSADGKGGAFHNVGAATLTINNSEIELNTAVQGGAIFENATPNTITTRVTNSLFNANAASNAGGAIFNKTGLVYVTANTFINNSAVEKGGAIRNGGSGRVQVTQSTFDTNTAHSGGAIYDATATSLTLTTDITTSTFVNNYADHAGGAIYYQPQDGVMSVVNSTFSANTSGNFAGAIYNAQNNNGSFSGGRIDIANATFYGNRAYRGATIYNEQGLDLRNTIISNSDDLTVGDPDNACEIQGSIPTGSTNLIGTYPASDASCGSNLGFNRGAVSAIASVLQNNGGSTKTHALPLGSNAIDINTSGCTYPSGAPLTIDQRSESRPSGAGCDAGAYERTVTFVSEEILGGNFTDEEPPGGNPPDVDFTPQLPPLIR